jgi:hypothetical protein
MPLKVTPKPLLRLPHQQQPHRPLLKKPRSPLASNHSVDDNNDDYDNVIPDMHVGHRRPTLVTLPDDAEFSDHVTTRLFLARMLALKKYQEVWA